MPICESTVCNAPVEYLPTLTPKGRRKFVVVNPPEKRWIVNPASGQYVIDLAYQPHSETCLDRKKAEG